MNECFNPATGGVYFIHNFAILSPGEIARRIEECKEWDFQAKQSKGLYQGFVKNCGTVEEALYSVFTHLAAAGMDID